MNIFTLKKKKKENDCNPKYRILKLKFHFIQKVPQNKQWRHNLTSCGLPVARAAHGDTCALTPLPCDFLVPGLPVDSA